MHSDGDGGGGVQCDDEALSCWKSFLLLEPWSSGSSMGAENARYPREYWKEGSGRGPLLPFGLQDHPGLPILNATVAGFSMPSTVTPERAT